MRMRRFLALAGLAFCAAAASPDVPAGPFTIKFDRSFQVGQAFIYTMTHSERTTQTIDTPDGQTIATQSYKTLTLDGDHDYPQNRRCRPRILHQTRRQTSFTQQTDSTPPDTLLAPDSELTISYNVGVNVSFTRSPMLSPQAPLNRGFRYPARPPRQSSSRPATAFPRPRRTRHP